MELGELSIQKNQHGNHLRSMHAVSNSLMLSMASLHLAPGQTPNQAQPFFIKLVDPNGGGRREKQNEHRYFALFAQGRRLTQICHA